MKILHTSDWHLGKVFHEFSLLEDQKYFLSQITQTLDAAQKNGESYDALIIAGDVYDRAVPPPEAVKVLSGFLTETNRKFPLLHIFLISGNHDSPDRLSFAAEILDASRIHIVTGAEKLEEPVLLGEDGDRTAFYPVPFLTPGMLRAADDEHPLRSQEALLSAACGIIREHHSKNCPDAQICAVSHSFITASKTGHSERRFIGDVDSVPADVFEGFAYTALGHIHKFQGTRNNSVVYCGSPLVYAFDDCRNETVMLSVVLKKGAVQSIEKIKIEPLHKVVRLEGNFSDFYGSAASKEIIQENKNNYIEFVLDGLSGVDNPIGLLRQNFPHTLSIRRAEKIPGKTGSKKHAVLEGGLKDQAAQLFDDFISDVYSGQTDFSSAEYQEEKNIFVELTKQESL